MMGMIGMPQFDVAVPLWEKLAVVSRSAPVPAKTRQAWGIAE
jgi:hypothetical protein